MMITIAPSNAGVHQPDKEHGRPEQSNFSNGLAGTGLDLGQSTYAKQC